MNTDQILQIVKIVGVIGAAAAIFLAGMRVQYQSDLHAPADTTITHSPADTHHLPPQQLSGIGTSHDTSHSPAAPSTAFHAALPTILVSSDSARIDSLEDVIVDLLQSTTVTLRDSEGGTHQITFYPKQKLFSELYTPIIIIQPEQHLITQHLPAPELHALFALMASYSQQFVGVSPVIGYDHFIASVTVMQGRAPTWSAGAVWRF